MKKKLILFTILSIFLIFFISSSFLYFYFFKFRKLKYLTNIDQLYSFFTDYMREIADYHLRLIDCKPKKYTYSTSQICFLCKELQACFPYALVDKGSESLLFNPSGDPFLLGIKRITRKVGDFYKDGLATLFNCSLENERTLKCDFTLEFVLFDNSVNIFLGDRSHLPAVAKRICEKIVKNTEIIDRGYALECGNLRISLTRNNLLHYFYYYQY